MMAYEERLAMFDRYIHTCRCSDENGWFASFCPDGKFDDEMFEYRSTGCETEEEAVRLLIQAACKDILTVEMNGDQLQKAEGKEKAETPSAHRQE